MFRLPFNLDPRRKQKNKLLEIGVYLQDYRRELNLELPKIAETTSIPVRLLEAIESGDLDSLPEPIYIRWLIRQFANSLGLEGEKISLKFPVENRSGFSFPVLNFSLPEIQIKPLHLYFIYILLVIFSVNAISNNLKQASRTAILPPPPLPDSQTAKVTKPRVQNVSNNEDKKQVIVDVKIKDDCWIKVVADGKTQFEGMLPQGTHRTWQADRSLTVRAGNAGGVYVAFNNADARKLGRVGQVEEVTYTAN